MRYWYIVELKCELDGDKLGKPISAETVDVIPRYTDGFNEWHDTAIKEDGVYTCTIWHKTKAAAEKEKRIWMKPARA